MIKPTDSPSAQVKTLRQASREYWQVTYRKTTEGTHKYGGAFGSSAPANFSADVRDDETTRARTALKIKSPFVSFFHGYYDRAEWGYLPLPELLDVYFRNVVCTATFFFDSRNSPSDR